VGDRSVKIRLTAEAKSLISELKASASAAEELKTATGSVKRELGDLQNRSDKAGTSLLKLAADGKIAGEGLKAADKQLNDLNRDLAKMGSAQVGGSKGVAGSLTAQIKDAEAELKKLAEEFRNTGSASSLSGFRSAEKELGKLKGLLSEVERIGNSGGGNNSKGFFSNLISSGQGALDQQLAKGFEMSLTNPYVLGAAAAAAVPLGAVIGGAVLTGVGLVGIGGGIAGQIKDPAVVKAAGELAADFKTVFKGATDSFRGPLVGAVHTFDDELHKLGPGLTDTFRGLAGSVDKLAGGAAGFIDELVPGLERAALASRPLISDLSTWLPRLGGELGGIFDVIASHSQEARAGLSILTTTLDVLLNTAKTGITIMSGLFDAAKFSTLGIGFLSAKSDADQTSNAFDDLDESTAALGQTTDQLANAYDPLLAALQKTEVTTSTLAGAMSDKLLNAMQGVDNATLGIHRSLSDLDDALKKNGLNFDENTRKGQDNVGAILQAEAANQRLYDQQIQNGISADVATRAYDANSAALRQQLRDAGATDRQVTDLTGAYAAVPDDVQTDIAANGLTSALNNIGSLLARLNGLNGNDYGFTVTERHVYESDYVSHSRGEQQPGKYALGGVMIPAARGLSYGIYPVSNPPLIKFAEPQTGGETLIPNRGIPAARGLALADYAASNYGGRVVGGGGGWGGGAMTINVVVTDDTGRQLKVIRKMVDRAGGGNVQVAFGKSGR
jgi:hypothetical protein